MIDSDQCWITSYNGRNYYYYMLRKGLYKNISEIEKDRTHSWYVSRPDIPSEYYITTDPIRDSAGIIIAPENFQDITANISVLEIQDGSHKYSIPLSSETLFELIEFAKEKKFMVQDD